MHRDNMPAAEYQPQDRIFCNCLAPLRGCGGICLKDTEYALAFLTLLEGLLVGIYFGEWIYLVGWELVLFAVTLVAAITLNLTAALYAMYGYVINTALHILCILLVVANILMDKHDIGHSRIIHKTEFYLFLLGGIGSWFATYIAWSFWAQLSRGQFALATGEKKPALPQ
eukprot:Blabericola_migrator_1__122@NODE_1030_length_5652_cov_194_902238_g710_i0_p4_GENE_NODE_1030_length_5652_cov_194_902238_g710_i0NODE_1030_length_5652_cov_194_902238_g710_i0_p4_ORF_typecomplete_len170_score27_90_NODE_1030_length_5652_cov_194_902238_g710_i050575566